MTNTYADPAAPGATGDNLELKELNGSLLLIEVLGIKEDIATKFGAADAISANVAVLDGAKKATEYNDTLIFPKMLVGQLRPSIGGKVVARLGQGTAQAGKSAPWILTAATDADKETAGKFEAYKATQAKPPADDAPF
jgi:hypothetical protein